MNDEMSDDGFNDRLWRAYTALVERKKGKGVSQGAIAGEITALGHPTRQDEFSRWLRRVGRPSFEALPSVAKVLGVRHYWLAFGEGPMIEPKAVPAGPSTTEEETLPVAVPHKPPQRKSKHGKRQRPR